MREAIAWYLQATGGYGVKLVNPGGVEMWKRGNGNVTSLDDEGPGVTPRQVIETIAGAVHELGLPHPVHVHCNNLGVAGNYRTTLDTLRTLEGRRAHLAHIQFHAYGGKPGGRPRSRAPELAEYLGAHPELSADVGQVMFGPATTMTADAPVSAVLSEITHGKWVNADTEAETGCGIVPFTYRERNYVHALQWGIGLELFLLSRDPWRLVLSTDHPNGGSFLSYPRLIRLLMDREFRNEQIRRVNKQAMKRTVLLDDLDREYTLEEIAIITRAGPARLLGLATRATSASAPTPTSRSTSTTTTARRCSPRRATSSRTAARSSRTASCARPARAACCGSAPSTTRASSRRWSSSSRTATACSSRAIR